MIFIVIFNTTIHIYYSKQRILKMSTFNKKRTILIEIEKHIHLHNLHKYDGFNLIYTYK